MPFQNEKFTLFVSILVLELQTTYLTGWENSYYMQCDMDGLVVDETIN